MNIAKIDDIKTIEVEDRKFQIRKFDARTSLKAAKLLISKLLPAAEAILPAFAGDDGGDKKDGAEEGWGFLENISFEKISAALDYISDEDLDKIIDISMLHCSEILPAGPRQVMSKGGVFNVVGIENDFILMLRLTVEAVLWSVNGFFGEGRLKAVLSPLSNSFKLSAPM